MKKIKSVILITALNNNNEKILEHSRDQRGFSLVFKGTTLLNAANIKSSKAHFPP